MNAPSLQLIERLSRAWWGWVTAASWQLALLTCLVAAAVVLLRRASPRLRHALWLLVIIKVFIPPGLTAPWSVGRLARPWLDAAGVLSWRPATDRGTDNADANLTHPTEGSSEDRSTSADVTHSEPASTAARLPATAWLMFTWGAGLFLFWGLVACRYARVLHALRAAQVIDEGPLRVELERIGLALRVKRLPELLATSQVTSPFLFGVVRPRIVLPVAMLDGLADHELRAVLTHELVHWQRHDVLVGWLQVAAQGLFWFHPFVWWANRELRHERECVCDEAVLRQSELPAEQYGDSIVRVLTAARGRSLAAGSLVGVFERGTKLQNRLEEIMEFETRRPRSSWLSGLAVALFALLAFPMAPGAAPFNAAAEDKSAAEAPAATTTKYPQIVATEPAIGATDVDPNLSSISVTFDRDMQGGMSWTGGPPEFPETRKGEKAAWKDRRTCLLRVKLAGGTLYRVGINSTSYQNFRSAEGVAARPAAIYFVTKGAAPDVVARVRAPKVASIFPADGAKDVDPNIKQLSVTFDIPMGQGMSWVDVGPNFPTRDKGRQAAWTADGLTCTLPVKLEPDHDYQFGLNDPDYINFQSRFGVPLAPKVYRFRTAAK